MIHIQVVKFGLKQKYNKKSLSRSSLNKISHPCTTPWLPGLKVSVKERIQEEQSSVDGKMKMAFGHHCSDDSC